MPATAKKVKPKISIAVIGYDPLRFVGLRTILESDPDFSVQALGVLNLAYSLRCDVVLLGSHGMSSLHNAIANLRSNSSHSKIILTGAPAGDDAMLRAIAAGVKGYLDEAAGPEEYKQAIRVVHSGSMWAPRKVLAKFIEQVTANSSTVPISPVGGVSERERQVLELLVAGRTNKEIGAELGIEERTEKAHITKLMQKAGVQNRIALSVHALTHSLLGGA